VAKRTLKKKTGKATAKRSVKRRRAPVTRGKTTRRSKPRPAAKKAGPRKAAVAAAPRKAPPVVEAVPGPDGRKPRQAGRLSRKDLELFHQILLEKRAQLIGDLDALHSQATRSSRQEAAGDLSSMPIHMADLGTDNFEHEFTLGLLEGEREVLREIDEALKRVEDGTYGFCLATGNPIGKARLKAQPWAKYCYEYTLEQERGRSRRY